MQNKSRALVALNNIEEAIDLLASTAVAAREKRAEDPPAPNMFQVAGDWMKKNVTDPTINSVTTPIVEKATTALGGKIDSTTKEIGKHLGWGLLGAGAGGALGLGSQMFAPPKRRRPLSSMITGGLLGGALGGAGSLLHSYGPELFGEKAKNEMDPNSHTAKDLALVTARENERQNPPYKGMLAGPFGSKIHVKPTLAAGAIGLGTAGALDAAGAIRTAYGGRRLPTASELLANIDQLTAEGKPEIAEYIKRVNSEHGPSGVQRVINGEKVPVKGELHRQSLRDAATSFRDARAQATAATAAERQPAVDIDLLGSKVDANTRAMLQRTNAAGYNQIMADQSLDAAGRLQAMEAMLKGYKGGPVNIAGVNHPQHMAALAEVNRIRTGLASGTLSQVEAQEQLANLSRSGIDIQAIEGKYDQAHFGNQMRADMGTRGFDAKAWNDIPANERNIIWEKMKTLPPDQKLPIRLANGQVIEISGTQASAYIGAKGGGSPGVNVPKDFFQTTPHQPVVSPTGKGGAMTEIEAGDFRRALQDPELGAKYNMAEVAKDLGRMGDRELAAIYNEVIKNPNGPPIEIPGKAYSVPRATFGYAIDHAMTKNPTGFFRSRFGAGSLPKALGGGLPRWGAYSIYGAAPMIGTHLYLNHLQGKPDYEETVRGLTSGDR